MYSSRLGLMRAVLLQIREILLAEAEPGTGSKTQEAENGSSDSAAATSLGSSLESLIRDAQASGREGLSGPADLRENSLCSIFHDFFIWFFSFPARGEQVHKISV